MSIDSPGASPHKEDGCWWRDIRGMRNTHYIVAGLSDADMVWLLSMGKLRRLKTGDALVSIGRATGDLFFITKGSFAVRLDDGLDIATLATGDVVGEMSFIEQHPPSVSVIATEGAEVLAIPRQSIVDRFAQEPVFAARFYRAIAVFLSAKLRQTTEAARHADEHHEVHQAVQAAGARFGRLLQMLRG